MPSLGYPLSSNVPEVRAVIEIKDALREHQAVIAARVPFAAEIRKAAHRMADCLAAGGKILWMGNGGSAAESHPN